MLNVNVVLLTVAHAGANDGAPNCTLATLKGRYLFAAPTTLELSLASK
jgi:hypothetical protein